MTLNRTYIPDPIPSEHAQAPPSASGANLPADEPVWRAARASYLKGCSTPVIAERHGLNERTVRRRAAQEGWPEMRRRLRIAENEQRRLARLAGEPETQEEAFARNPALADFAEAHTFEIGQLLMKPDADRLARFAFRRAAEMAAQGQPVEAQAWMRLVGQADRMRDQRLARSVPVSIADHLRGAFAEKLHDAYQAALEGDEDEAGEAEHPMPGVDGEAS